MLFELFVRCPCYKYSKLNWGRRWGGGFEWAVHVYEEGQENMSFFITEHKNKNKIVFEILSYEFKKLVNQLNKSIEKFL